MKLSILLTLALSLLAPAGALACDEHERASGTIQGTVKTLTETSLTVHTPDNKDITVTLNPKTKIETGSKPLAVGQPVIVQAKAEGTSAPLALNVKLNTAPATMHKHPAGASPMAHKHAEQAHAAPAPAPAK